MMKRIKIIELLQGKHLKYKVILSVLVLIFLLNSSLSKAEIRFVVEPLIIEGIPTDFFVNTWTFANMEGVKNHDIIVAGMWQERTLFLKTENYSGILIISSSNNSLKVTGKSLKKRLSTQKESIGNVTQNHIIQQLSHCDLDKDGREEVFAVYNSAPDFMVTKKNGELKEYKSPLKDLIDPTILWFDYDGDGWTDLFLAGAQPIKGKENELRGVYGEIYKNYNGKLSPTKMVFDIPEIVTSAYVINFDEDGRPDLFLSVGSGCNAVPSFNRIFLNRDDHFEEVKFPLNGVDKLRGLTLSSLAKIDVNDDALEDLLVSGLWDGRLGRKAYLSLVYHKRSFVIDGKKKFCLDYDLESMNEIPNIRGEFIVEDLDGDTDKDIILSGLDTELKWNFICFENKKRGLHRIGRNLLTNKKELFIGDTNKLMLIPFDTNRDGLVDLICFPRQSDKEVFLLRNISKVSSP